MEQMRKTKWMCSNEGKKERKKREFMHGSCAI